MFGTRAQIEGESDEHMKAFFGRLRKNERTTICRACGNVLYDHLWLVALFVKAVAAVSHVRPIAWDRRLLPIGVGIEKRMPDDVLCSDLEASKMGTLGFLYE